MNENFTVRLREVCRFGNLLVPPVSRAADPVSLDMIFYLFDRADEVGCTFAQGRALDILLIAYATISRLGEICKLRTDEVEVPEDDKIPIRISFVQKPAHSKGTRIQKVVPRAKMDRSWCPRSILKSYWEIAKDQKRVFIFSGKEDKPTSTQAVDKALAAVVKKLAPEYPLRISGHSARRGAALEACSLGIPEAIIQSQGGWADPSTCKLYMAAGWSKVASIFTSVEAACSSINKNEDNKVA